MLFYVLDKIPEPALPQSRTLRLGSEFNPRAEQITFSSVIGQGILHKLDALVPI